MSTNKIPYELPYMAHVDKDNVMTITPKSYPELTKEQAVDCAVFHTNKCHRIFGALGAVNDIIESWTRNGKTQTWKTRPDEFRVPVHRGMYKKDQIWHQDKDTAHAATECPLLTMPHTRSKAANEVCQMLDEATEKLKAQIPSAVQRVYANQLSNEYIQLGKGRDIEETCEHPEGREDPCIHDAMIQNSPARQLAADILGIIDTFLDDRNIIVPNDERDDIESPAAICGSDYYELEDTITALLEGKAVKIRDPNANPNGLPFDSICNSKIAGGDFTCVDCKQIQPHDVTPYYIKPEKPLCANCYDKGMSEISNLNKVLPADGYADGGEPYTEEELAIINEEPKPTEEKWRVDVQGVGENNWSSNGLEYPDAFKASAYARDLYSRWTGMSAWRVVPTTTPKQERVLDEHKGMIVDAKGNISKP
jgi:hypothetical protein